MDVFCNLLGLASRSVLLEAHTQMHRDGYERNMSQGGDLVGHAQRIAIQNYHVPCNVLPLMGLATRPAILYPTRRTHPDRRGFRILILSRGPADLRLLWRAMSPRQIQPTRGRGQGPSTKSQAQAPNTPCTMGPSRIGNSPLFLQP